MKTALYFIHALSPLHAGTGQSVGAIDLPIARERPTGIPLVPGSSIKGALRARYERPDKPTIFGPDTKHASEFGGAVQFADAHLLLLPVRSVAGTFAWVTSPYLLQRFARDAHDAGRSDLRWAETIELEKQCFIGTAAAIKMRVDNGQKVILEDLDFEPVAKGSVDTLASNLGILLFPDDQDNWRDTLKKRLCIVHDDVMSLLLETATEVVARIKLNEDTKTVDKEKGALWYEEALPTESVLVGLVVASQSTEKVVDDKLRRDEKTPEALLEALHTFTHSLGMLQLGGKATVGRGVCTLRVARNVAKSNQSAKAGAK